MSSALQSIILLLKVKCVLLFTTGAEINLLQTSLYLISLLYFKQHSLPAEHMAAGYGEEQ